MPDEESQAERMIREAKEEVHKPFTEHPEQDEWRNGYIINPAFGKHWTEAQPKKLEGFVTDTFLDKLFLTVTGEILNGIPKVAQLGITGLPSAGKSILIEELAVRASHSGKKVVLITSEDRWGTATERFDLQSRCKQKAELLMLDWSKVLENLYVIDVAELACLRDWNEFVKTYRFLCEKVKIDLALFDSMTMLEDYRASLKMRLRELSLYNQEKGITGIYVNQRASEEADIYSIAGGIGLAHNLDGVIILDYMRAYHGDFKQDLGASHLEFVRFVRVLGCRLCGFDVRRHRLEISKEGFLKMIPNPEPKPEKEKKPKE